ncbi:DUF2851 family protein [Arundinibacter roseus]|uniref:DUF2851 family protein n=1 Tax=Arundinibacter roseus TaxID=2070510 RepID=A0A4V2X9V5_9BACT|nr:DUF2851 family protein [Arundinibacter roseus]TDB65285.1 DUF2851 family protein [Arundinibacter roseus]
MNEDFLSFVWRFQYFDTTDLQTQGGESLQILRTGYLNTDAGPDFSEARLLLNGIEWAGCVELHVKSSDWAAHKHPTDPAYESVILHVVWEDDLPITHQDRTLVPTLVLNKRVGESIFSRYHELMDQTDDIPCASLFDQVSSLQKLTMLDRVLLERLDARAQQVRTLWEANQRDWDETAYQWLARHYGFRLNAPAFQRLAELIPLRIIQKHRSSLLQIEALLFGVAGLLPEIPQDDYERTLIQEYRFLAAKYDLLDKQMATHEWKFLRLRPAGFPTVRLAQLALFLQNQPRIFSVLTNPESLTVLRNNFRVSQSDYWKKHYRFGKTSAVAVPSLGADAADLLVINGAIPLLVAHARHLGQESLLDRAIEWLEQCPAEKNHLITEWEKLGMSAKTAFDTQALMEWHKNYCSPKRCLECTVGAALLKPSAS